MYTAPDGTEFEKKSEYGKYMMKKYYTFEAKVNVLLFLSLFGFVL